MAVQGPRSALLANGAWSTAGWVEIYTGPAGWTTLVKHLSIQCTGGTPGWIELWQVAAGRSAAIWQVNAAINGVYVFPSQTTVTAGGNLTLRFLSATASSWVCSGAVLEGVPPFQPQGPKVTFDLSDQDEQVIPVQIRD